ncbi:hypothetical protein L7F22_011703 [Adiantum nelumboides]|nr:hypothetical protein [Adiantum nelumboides]
MEPSSAKGLRGCHSCRPPSALVLALYVTLVYSVVGASGTALFHPRDILPAFPHQIAWPILNTFSNSTVLLPEFVGTVNLSTQSVSWEGSCFADNEAYLEIAEDGGTLHIETSQPHTWTCMDLYVFVTAYSVTWDYYFTARKHTLDINKWEDGELEYVKKHGISVFLMPSGMLGTVQALWDVLPLFSNTGWGESSNLAFLEKHMGAKLVKRAGPSISNFSIDDIHSGDFLALSKIRGRWGGFETLEKWVTGAYAGHTAVCLRDEENKLWVAESGHENEQGEEIIAILSWEEWWQLQLVDTAHSHVALLPLHPDVRATFNNSAAWEHARKMDGKPYGYHNMIFSWIDTETDNFPPPIDAHLVMSVMTIWTRMQPDYAANMWNEALNKRLGTEGLDLPSILIESDKKDIPFERLLAMPESDDWIYSDGKSTSCVAFILAMYKAAGLFGPLADSIQITEFTIKDAYMLKFFENDTSRLPAWCNARNKSPLPYCQLLGEYLMELPDYSTVAPYAHMNERCPSMPPDYERPAQC